MNKRSACNSHSHAIFLLVSSANFSLETLEGFSVPSRRQPAAKNIEDKQVRVCGPLKLAQSAGTAAKTRQDFLLC